VQPQQTGDRLAQQSQERQLRNPAPSPQHSKRPEDDACILLRLSPEKFVAFNQNCTHLNCPVHFESASSRLVCPCHHGFFNAEDGQTLSGPPRRGLAALSVSVRDGKVWVQSQTEKEIT